MGHELARRNKNVSKISHVSTPFAELFERSDVRHPLKETDSFIELRKNLGCCTKFAIFMYNKENKTVMNRSRKHWGVLCIYYIMFLITVITFFVIFFFLTRRLMTNANDSEPAILKTSVYAHPHITFVPLRVDPVSEPLIWFGHTGDDRRSNRRGISYVKAINDYMESEERKCLIYKIEDCPINKEAYGPCGTGTFGYDDKQPCIFIKMTHLDGWAPSSFRKKKHLPAHTPKEMRQIIEVKKEVAWVYCTGATEYDKEHLGKITYIPKQFFDEQFFPMKRADLINPILAIQLKEIHAGYILKMTCELLAGNIPISVKADLNIYMRLF